MAVTTPIIADPEKEQQKWVPRTKHQPPPEQQQEPKRKRGRPKMEKTSAILLWIEDVPEEKDILEDLELLSSDKPKDGYGLKSWSGFIAGPNNIVDELSRLEVLIRGKRAGNNSPEIINEATGICQRLFQRVIIVSKIYRGLIDELADGYYSD